MSRQAGWRPWTVEEQATLRGMAGSATAGEIGKALGRSEAAVNGQKVRLGLRPVHGAEGKRRYGLTGTDVARILGVDRKTVRRLIVAGALAGERVATQRVDNRGFWRIWPDDLARLLRERPDLYDARRIADPTYRALAAEPRRLQERWLRVDEVARRLFLSPAGVRQTLRLGDLQGVLVRDRTGISWRVLESSVRVYRPPDLPGRRGLSAETRRRREETLAERAALQERYDREAARLVAKKRCRASC